MGGGAERQFWCTPELVDMLNHFIDVRSVSSSSLPSSAAPTILIILAVLTVFIIVNVIVVRIVIIIVLILAIVRSVSELAKAKTWENLVRRSCPFFTLTGLQDFSGDLEAGGFVDWVEERLSEEEISTSQDSEQDE